MQRSFLLALALLSVFGPPARLSAATLHLGAATADITPDQPVALDGQRNVRISQKPATPIQASVLAIESREGDKIIDQAVIVSCDLVAIRDGVLQQVREKLVGRVTGLDLQKLLSSTSGMPRTK